MELKLQTDDIEALQNSANKHYDDMVREIQFFCPHDIISRGRNPKTKEIRGANCLICGKTLGEE